MIWLVTWVALIPIGPWLRDSTYRVHPLGLKDTTYRVPLLDSKLVRLRYAWYYRIKSPSGPSSVLTPLGTPQPSFWTLNAVEPCLTYPNLYIEGVSLALLARQLNIQPFRVNILYRGYNICRYFTSKGFEYLVYWRASEASETLSGLFNRESRIYVIVKARQRGNYAAKCPSPRALARVRRLLQLNFRGNPLL